MRSGLKALSLLAPLGLSLAAAQAHAASADDRFLHFGGESEAPRGYVELCQTMASVCRGFGGSVVLTAPDPAPTPGGPYCPDFACLIARPAPASASVMVQSSTLAPFPSIAALAPVTTTRPVFTLMPLFRTAEPLSPPPVTAPEDEREMTRLIARINARVNHNVHQALDMRTYGRDDVWRPSGTGAGAAGDCEDLALEKRLELIGAGFPAERLFMAIVFRPDVGLHAVLVARLPSGDHVLDSRVDYIQRWARSGYAWLNVEQPGAPERWYFAV
jgi:predicted transglutaminase-like cysteine proteinase